MLITLTPQRSDTSLTLARADTALVINGVSFDFGPLPEGAVLPREAVDCPALASDVARIDGVLHLTLILPVGANPPLAARFPAPIHVTADGSIALPARDVLEEAP